LGFLNATGILSLRKDGSTFRTSKLLVFVNILRVCFIVVAGKFMMNYAYANSIRKAMSLTMLSGIISKIQIERKIWEWVVIIVVQLLTSNSQADLINSMSLLYRRLTQLKHRSLCTEEYKRFCVRHIGVIWTVYLACSGMIVSSSFDRTVFSFLIAMVPFMFKLLYFSYIFVIVHFLNFSQQCMIVYVEENFKTDDQSLDCIQIIRSSLHQINRSCLKTLSFPFFLTLLFFISQIVCQVNEKFCGK
jgi:hypothetical protein